MTFACATTSVIYLLQLWPLSTPGAVLLEVFNEATIVVLTYHMICFTDFVPDANTRYPVGYSYIAFASASLLIHILIMMTNFIRNLVKYSKPKWAAFKQSEAEAERRAHEKIEWIAHRERAKKIVELFPEEVPSTLVNASASLIPIKSKKRISRHRMPKLKKQIRSLDQETVRKSLDRISEVSEGALEIEAPNLMLIPMNKKLDRVVLEVADMKEKNT